MSAVAHWLLDNGVGQNITASAILVAAGWGWSKTRFWPLRAIEKRLEALHTHHQRLGRSLIDAHEKLDRLEQTLGRGEETGNGSG